MKKRNLRKQELKKQLKRKKRRRIMRRTLCFLLILFGLGLAIYALVTGINAGEYDVQHFEVVGNEVVDAQTVIDGTGITQGQSMFTINFNEAYAGIQRSVKAEKLHITLKFPDTVIISITEEEAVCAIMADNKAYYLDQDGMVVEISDYLRKSDIPLISGLTSPETPMVGQRITLEPDWKYAEVHKMLMTFLNSGYTAKISEIIATANNDYKIITKNNIAFSVLDYNNFNENYDYIGTVIASNQSNLDISLRTGSNPIIKDRK